MTDWGPWFVAGYIVAYAVEIYFFLMQRVPLEVAREHDLDPGQARLLMLPDWYMLVYPVKVLRYVLLFFVWRSYGWIVILVLLAIPFLLSARIPVPYAHFANRMQNRILAGMARARNPTSRGIYLEALISSRTKHGF